MEKNGYYVGTYRKSWGPGNGQPAGQAYKSVDSFFAHRPQGKPFCFWFGASDPHRDYEAGSGKARGMDLEQVHLFGHFPDHETVRSDVADYYYEVERFDRELGELLDRLAAAGELENTLVVVTGDHGMPFPRCKANLYDSGVHVPLAISWPAKVPAGSGDRRFRLSYRHRADVFSCGGLKQSAGDDWPFAFTAARVGQVGLG